MLSSNDGCIVALTPEAKKVGLHRGDPIFKVREIVNRHKVALFSTNMYLYAAMSKRIINILRSEIKYIENYSIDESFCYLDGYAKHYDLVEMMRGVVEKIKLYTDIPVSVGIAPTKTLAKLTNKFAKSHRGYRSVCMIEGEEKRRKALALFELADVWGIGRQTLSKLNYLGVHTTLEFADKKESWVKHHFTLPVVQTWRELNGIPCIDTREVTQKQSICTSRSFGQMITDLPSLRASVASYTASSANKLRGQRSLAGAITVFVMSNRFREDLPQYHNALTRTLAVPTADTLELTALALSIVEELYREGINYKKAGVILGNITAATAVQQHLFDEIRNRPQRFQLMNTIDNLNHRYGLKSVRLAIEEKKPQHWHAKSEYRSYNYLSDINEILTIRI